MLAKIFSKKQEVTHLLHKGSALWFLTSKLAAQPGFGEA